MTKKFTQNGNGIERKFFSLKNFKSVDEGPGSFEGHMNNFGFLDDGADITVKGAFAGVLTDFLKSGFAAHSHDWDVKDGMIGYPMQAVEDDEGLWVNLKFHSTDDAQKVRTKAKERLADDKEVGVSIGYKSGATFFIAPKDYQSELPKYLKAEYLTEGLAKAATFPRVRVLTSIAELAECSIVARPMNTLSHVDGVKSIDGQGEEPESTEDLGTTSDAAPQAEKTNPPAANPPAPEVPQTPSPEAEEIKTLRERLTQLEAQVAAQQSDEPKAGARNSSTDKKKLQAIHDNAVYLESTVCTAEKAVVVGAQVKGMYEDALAEMTTPTMWQVYYAFLDVLDMIEDLPETVGDTVVDKPSLVEEALQAMVTAMREAALAKLDEPEVEYIYWGAPPESFKELSSGLVSEPFAIHQLAVVTAVRELATRSGVVKEAVEVFTERAREKQEFRTNVDGRPVSAITRVRKSEMDKGLKDASESLVEAAQKSESLTFVEPEDLTARFRAEQLRTARLHTQSLAS